jgi:dephospho-CoA kinase
MSIIGITGGIGSGKSTLSAKLREAGFSVYDTDAAARRLQNENTEIRNNITAIFGSKSYTDNVLNRSYIAGIVFNQPELLRKLNLIVHPAVRVDFKEWCTRHKKESTLFLECAILFEGEFNKLVDKIILVTAPQSVRIQRVMKRDGVTESQVLQRINNQLSDADNVSKSDLIIDTNVTDIHKLDISSFLSSLTNE